MRYILFLDGIIGSGKSFSIQRYKSIYPQLKIVLEPIELWEESGMLEKFYSDIKKYAFEWQVYVQSSFLEVLNKTLLEAEKDNDCFILVERGHLAAYTVFSYMLWQDGCLTDQEYDKIRLLHEKYDRDLRLRGFVCDHIFLDTSVDVSMERMKTRNRKNESVSVTREYQERLYNRFYELNLTPYSVEQLDELIKKIMADNPLDKSSKSMDKPLDKQHIFRVSNFAI